MSSTITIPAPLRTFYSYFPLYTYPAIPPPNSRPITKPTLWILPPRNPDSDQLLSSDVECLKWQAFLALRGFSDIAVRWDVSPDGAIDGRLPNLHLPRGAGEKDDGGGELLAAHMIHGWVEKEKTGGEEDVFEGYIDETAKDESHAWVALLEGKVHAALVGFAFNCNVGTTLIHHHAGPITTTTLVSQLPPHSRYANVQLPITIHFLKSTPSPTIRDILPLPSLRYAHISSIHRVPI